MRITLDIMVQPENMFNLEGNTHLAFTVHKKDGITERNLREIGLLIDRLNYFYGFKTTTSEIEVYRLLKSIDCDNICFYVDEKGLQIQDSVFE